MRDALTPFRRCTAAAIALLASAALLRAPIADALVVRGDDLLYQNRRDAALDHYSRALALDPQSATAADRYVFVMMQRHTARALADALSAASHFLAKQPMDAPVRADRAMCYLLVRKYNAARADFELAGRSARQPKYYVFAGWAALRAHDRLSARRLWHAALALDRHYKPARSALEDLRS